MICWRWVAVICLVITTLSAGAQDNNTDELITIKGTMWQGNVIRDTALHTYTIVTRDTQVVFKEDEVQKIVHAREDQLPGTEQAVDAPKRPHIYYVPYTSNRHNALDYVITKKGDLYKGWVTEDHIKDYVIMYLPDSTNIKISYKDIRRVDYSDLTWKLMEHKEALYKQPESPGAKLDRLERIHNAGLGLTISGGVLLAVGIPMIAAGVPQATTVTAPGYAGVRLTGVGAVGAIFSIIGTGLIIPGAIKLAKYVRIHKQQKIVEGNL